MYGNFPGNLQWRPYTLLDRYYYEIDGAIEGNFALFFVQIVVKFLKMLTYHSFLQTIYFQVEDIEANELTIFGRFIYPI